MRIVLFILAVLVAPFVHAQQIAPANTTVAQPATAERPSIKVGDSWTYEKIDNWRNVVQEKYAMDVSMVSDKEIQLTRKSEKSGAVANVTETLDLNTLTGLSGSDGSPIRYSPDNGTYAFPLSVGKTWEMKSDFVKSTGFHSSVTFTAKVVSFEKVQVPAGEFDAFKITYTGGYRGMWPNGNSGTGSMKMTIWYAPSVKGAVKTKYEDTNWDGSPYDKSTFELLAYKVN